jgi:putative membrane protein
VTARYRWTLAAFLVFVAVTWWRPIYPAEQALHHSLTVVALVALLALVRRASLPYGSFVLVLVFLTLHTIAARWIYSFVPYDEWLRSLFGIEVSGRNDFDRLVHFSYGACLGPVLFRYLVEQRGWRVRWAALSAVEVVLSTGALYELFEWAVAMTLAPGAAEAYNGQQGDMWDAQKDMAIATLGAVLAVGTIAVHTWSHRVQSIVDRSSTHV